MSNTSNLTTVPMVLVPGGYWVQKDFLDELRRQVAAAIPRMKFGVEYRIQRMVDPVHWTSLSPQERRMAGRCLAHLVADRKLALAFVSCPRCTNKVYRRI